MKRREGQIGRMQVRHVWDGDAVTFPDSDDIYVKVNKEMAETGQTLKTDESLTYYAAIDQEEKTKDWKVFFNRSSGSAQLRTEGPSKEVTVLGRDCESIPPMFTNLCRYLAKR